MSDGQYEAYGRGYQHRNDRNGDHSRRRGREEEDDDCPKRQRRGFGEDIDPGAGPSHGNGRNGTSRGSVPPGRGGGRAPERGRRAWLSPEAFKRKQDQERNARIQKEKDDYDNVVTKPSALTTKRGQAGQAVGLKANFYKVLPKGGAWLLYNYRVDFDPEEELTHVKRSILRTQPHLEALRAYVFDGTNLYSPHLYPEDQRILYTAREDESTTTITLKLVGTVEPGDVQYLQVYAIIVRTCLRLMGLDELGRHFFDRENATALTSRGLQIWPGYSVALRSFDEGLLVNIDLRSKVLRLDSCLDIIRAQKARGGREEDIKAVLVGSIVITHYNRKTYKVNDIDFSKSPLSTFLLGNEETTFKDYYKEKYPTFTITDEDQPLIMSRLGRKERHRGETGDVLLVPELCNITGLSDSQRKDHKLMQEVRKVTSLRPSDRCLKMDNFMLRLRQNQVVRDKFNNWNLAVGGSMVDVPGRLLPPESLLIYDKNRALDKFPVDPYSGDWTAKCKTGMYSSVGLRKWALLIGDENRNLLDQLLGTLASVAKGMNFALDSHPEVMFCRDGWKSPDGYLKAIENVMGQMKDCQLIFVVLSSASSEIYGAIKRRCNLDYGIASQCFQKKHLTKGGGLGSVCTKVVIQMNAKLGGEPWLGSNPFKSSHTMVIGFDVHHSGKGMKTISIGAMVATTNNNFSKFYSAVSAHSDRASLSENMCADFTKCLNAFRNKNGVLPERVIFYRGGVGQGDLTYVNGTEFPQIIESMRGIYGEAGRGGDGGGEGEGNVEGGSEGKRDPKPKFFFIIVTKKGNARIFKKGHMVDNPAPGTCVDSVITLPERYDFFLVSQKARDGQTVSPITYNVLKADDELMDPDKIQRFTHKLCHLYYNWTGTVSVPMVCQYAQKLSYLTGTTYKDSGTPHENLAHHLYFL